MEPNLILERLQRMPRDRLIHELEHAHSEEFVIMFMGFLMTRNCLRTGLEPKELLDAWGAFKTEMGKRA